MNKQEIEKGCGKIYSAVITEKNIARVGYAFCDGNGEIPLCEGCQAKLQQRIDDEKEFKEMIDKLRNMEKDNFGDWVGGKLEEEKYCLTSASTNDCLLIRDVILQELLLKLEAKE